MTCTSGPGISLMSEFIGLAYFAEIPGVIWDVNRVGPSQVYLLELNRDVESTS